MRQGIDGDIKRELLALIGTDAFAFIAGVIGTERAAEPVLAHHRNQRTLVKETLQLYIAGFIQAMDTVNLVKRTVDQVVIRNRFDLLIRKNAAELTSPSLWEIRIGAAARGEKETTMTEILPQISYFGIG